MPQKHSATVLVIDSGIGGMSIVKQLHQLSDALSLIYVADNALFPYGSKEPEVLVSRLQHLIESVLKKCDIDVVVIGCNTATVLMIDKLRAIFHLPFVGIVPAIKTASEMSRSRSFTLLATENTAYSTYIDDLINSFAADCDVNRLGCPGLADFAEDKIYGREASQEQLQRIFSEVAIVGQSDVIVLGCTHYAFIIEELQALLGQTQTIIEPSLPVAKRVLWILEQRPSPEEKALQDSPNRFFSTREMETTAAFLTFLQEHGFQQTELL